MGVCVVGVCVVGVCHGGKQLHCIQVIDDDTKSNKVKSEQ